MKLREKTNKEIAEGLGLTKPFLSNVTEEDLTKKKIKATMEMIAKFEASTVGPYGATTIIQDREKNHLATKDGYDLLGRMVFDDDVARTVLEILRNIAGSQVTTVGDGSTSSIIVANALYSALTDSNSDLFSRVAPKDILDMLNELEPVLEDLVKQQARPISEDFSELEKIATVANNNDRDTGKTVADLYRKIGLYGFVTTDVLDPTPTDVIEFKEGISLRRGYLDKCFTTGNPTKIVKHEAPLLFLTTETFSQNSLRLLMDVIGHAVKLQKPLIIVCNGADADAMTFFKKNRTKHLGTNTPEIVFTVVDVDQVTTTGVSTLKNLALMTGCEIYDPLMSNHTHPLFVSKPEMFFGKASRAIITDKETEIVCDDTFLNEDQLKQKEDKIQKLTEDIKELEKIEDRTGTEEKDLWYLKVELNTLLGHSAIYHVGGRTMTERQSRERLVDDAVKACKSAIRFGFVPGGNLIIPKVISDNDDMLVEKLAEKFTYIIPPKNLSQKEFFKEFLNIIKNAFLESYRYVLNNAYFTEDEVEKIIKKCLTKDMFYNLKLHKYEKFEETEIINSTDTDLQIMRSCISIIGILATSNQFITLNYNMSGI